MTESTRERMARAIKEFCDGGSQSDHPSVGFRERPTRYTLTGDDELAGVIDAILAVLDEPSEGVRWAGAVIVGSDAQTDEHLKAWRAMLAAIREGK